METNELKRLYEQAGSCSELARWLGKSISTTRYHLLRAGVTLTKGYKSPKKVRHMGKEHHNWNGGTYDFDGYVMEYAPDHPIAKQHKGYVLQHRLVMERKLGRYLGSKELIHHINGDRADNRPENLEIKTRSTHMQHHKETAPRDDLGRFI